ncbi:hypothetical protein QE152_g38453 [Popillia japonica]|uniref:Uncharacterized protein n=1 Tax=Popillia japonica TaxID=7064 RepID=A0AAW1HWR9_POPJA
MEKTEKIKLIHTSGTEFYVFLNEYELARTQTDANFRNELIDKYYQLYKKGLASSIRQVYTDETSELSSISSDNNNNEDTDTRASTPLQKETIPEYTTASRSNAEWTDNGTKLLIQQYSELKPLVEERKIKTMRKMWETISEEFKKHDLNSICASALLENMSQRKDLTDKELEEILSKSDSECEDVYDNDSDYGWCSDDEEDMDTGVSETVENIS